MTLTIGDISIPDSKLARDITELVRDTESAAALPPFQPGLSISARSRASAAG